MKGIILTYEVVVYSDLCRQREIHQRHLLKLFIYVARDGIILMRSSFSLQHNTRGLTFSA